MRGQEFPQDGKDIIDPFDFHKEEEYWVVFVNTLLTNHHV
jgi:hypothetical protein